VIFENDTFKMFYNGYGVNTQRILYAYSTDGTSWTGYTAHPMLEPGASGSWDDWELGPMCVITDGSDYEMLYTGWDGLAGTATFQIGYAISMDGLNWTRYSNEPVLTPGDSGRWDDSAVAVPNVIREGNLYKMWYGGFDGTFYQTGYATSLPDHISWKNSTIPLSNHLLPNYPNPFNPTTVISWQLAVDSSVKLRVYDLTGQIVKVLVDEKQPTGFHMIEWDASGLPSGIYFYRLQAAGFIETRKMILIQ
jgi:hypothetical protein